MSIRLTIMMPMAIEAIKMAASAGRKFKTSMSPAMVSVALISWKIPVSQRTLVGSTICSGIPSGYGPMRNPLTPLKIMSKPKIVRIVCTKYLFLKSMVSPLFQRFLSLVLIMDVMPYRLDMLMTIRAPAFCCRFYIFWLIVPTTLCPDHGRLGYGSVYKFS